MANNPWDRTIVNPRERPISTDINQLQSQLARTISDTLFNSALRRAFNNVDSALANPPAGAAAFFGSGYRVRAGAGLSIALDAGLGFFNDNTSSSSLGGVTGLDDLEVIKPLELLSPETIALNPADPVNPRIDIVEVKFDRRLDNPLTRDVLAADGSAFNPAVVNKTLDYQQNTRSSRDGTMSINVKTGTPAGVPVPPATDAGYAKIAEISVPANAVALSDNNIADFRRLFSPDGIIRVSGSVLVNGAANPISYGIVAPPGIRVAIWRHVTAGNVDGFAIVIVAGDASQFSGGALTNPLISGGLTVRAETDFVVGGPGGVAFATGANGVQTGIVGGTGIPTQAQLVDGTQTAPPIAVSLRQRVVSIQFLPLNFVAVPYMFRFAAELLYNA